MAQKLAAKRNVSMTEAVIDALAAELKRESNRAPLTDRLAAMAKDLKAKAGKRGRKLSKDEIDDMWGQP